MLVEVRVFEGLRSFFKGLKRNFWRPPGGIAHPLSRCDDGCDTELLSKVSLPNVSIETMDLLKRKLFLLVVHMGARVLSFFQSVLCTYAIIGIFVSVYADFRYLARKSLFRDEFRT
jgi:hypothetical protein